VDGLASGFLGLGESERAYCTLPALFGDATVAPVRCGAAAGGGWGNEVWIRGLGWAPWLLSGRLVGERLVGSWRWGWVGEWTSRWAGKRPEEREGEARPSERGF
jgi:hypothetical protein